MSREILFRGMIKNKKGWEYGNLKKNRHDDHFIHFFECNGYECQYRVVNETVGQYTGLEDKNGVKIFEGDILQDYAKNEKPISQVIVIWNNGFWDGEPLNGSNYRLCYAGFKRSKIIGNIHDNPELLEQAHE